MTRLDNAVQHAARLYVTQAEAAGKHINNPRSLANWWLKENGNEARRKGRELMRDYDLTDSALAAAILSTNAPWLAAYRRRPPADNGQLSFEGVS